MPTFNPPTVNETPIAPPGTRGVEARLFRHYRLLKKGLTVIKRADGSWVVKGYPSDTELAAAERYYLGGHVHAVTDEEAAELVAAGFEDFIS